MKRPHEDKITFSLVYRTQFFYTTCTKLDLVHAFLFEWTLYARSEKKYIFKVQLNSPHKRYFSDLSDASYIFISLP